MSYSLNALYRVLGTSKQAVHQSKKRQIAFDKELCVLVKAADALKREHPGCGVEKMYYTLKPKTMGKDKFCEIFLKLGYGMKKIKNYRRTTVLGHISYPNLIAGLEVESPGPEAQNRLTTFTVQIVSLLRKSIRMEKTWWKEAVVYQIYPRSFLDTTGSGFGDLQGITQKLSYLKKLGIDVIWLSPIFQSPDDDNGYDVSDYCAIMDRLGTMEDFDQLLVKAHDMGLKIILDLVVNHSSDEHRWFQESRSSRTNPYRDFYFWRDEKPSNWLSFFGGDTWTYDDTTQSYYLHLFSKKQPDLNWENPEVREKVYELMHFWLRKGVDGFRMDVIPMISKYLDFPDIDRDDFVGAINTVYTNGPRVHEFLREMNERVLSHYDMMSMGEGLGVSPEQGLLYTGRDRKELHMLYHFDHMSLDWGKGGKFDPKPIKLTEFKRLFRTWHETLGEEGWITQFLDNHDFPRMVSRFGNDTTHRMESAKLLVTLLMTLRGTPCIYQGSEIGMINVVFPQLEDYDDIEIKNKIEEYKQAGRDLSELEKVIHKIARDNARTPMQWNDQKNGGFSTAEKTWIKTNPNYNTINVAAALRDPNSIWYYYQKAIKLRKDHPTLVYGDYDEYLPESEEVYLYRRWDADGDYIILLNFSDKSQKLPDTIPLKQYTLLIGNYTESREEELSPWEARVLKLKPAGV